MTALAGVIFRTRFDIRRALRQFTLKYNSLRQMCSDTAANSRGALTESAVTDESCARCHESGRMRRITESARGERNRATVVVFDECQPALRA